MKWIIPLGALTNWPFWLGLALYGVASLALARLPLNVAHSVLTSGAIATVALSPVLIFPNLPTGRPARALA
ncbi:hypothetical protein BZM26_27065 [Paraburkholderia strydomiana]|nr:hypothetical protein BZM26_27065 [Paraburkholderia strydomiana]